MDFLWKTALTVTFCNKLIAFFERNIHPLSDWNLMESWVKVASYKATFHPKWRSLKVEKNFPWYCHIKENSSTVDFEDKLTEMFPLSIARRHHFFIFWAFYKQSKYLLSWWTSYFCQSGVESGDVNIDQKMPFLEARAPEIFS